MDEVDPGATSSGVAAGEPLAAGQTGSHSEQSQQQQVVAPIPGARNYGYPDDFMMYVFKIELCNRTDKHPRATCPYAHPGDVARRRHPNRYQALLCPEVRAKKVCPRADECQCSHSAFEFWLHPDRYRTSMCEKGVRCRRPVCFFAHTSEELRPLPAGLKPAAPDATSSSKYTNTGSGASSSLQPPGSAAPLRQIACLPAGMTGGVRYVQQQAAQPQQQVVLQPGVQLMPVAPAAGGAAAFAPVGYVPVMQPGLEGAAQYGQMPGRFYSAEQQMLMVPAGQQQQYVMQPAVLPGQYQPQPAQLSNVMHQFQGLVVSSAPMAGQYEQPGTPVQWSGAGSSSSAGQQPVVMVMPGMSGPQSQQPVTYMQQPQMMYMPGAADQGSWSQQQYPLYSQGSNYRAYPTAYPAALQGAPQGAAGGPGSSGGSGMLAATPPAGAAGAPTAAGGMMLVPVMQQAGQQLPPVPGAVDVSQLGGAGQHGTVIGPVGMVAGDLAVLPQRNMPLAHSGSMQQQQSQPQSGLERHNW